MKRPRPENPTPPDTAVLPAAAAPADAALEQALVALAPLVLWLVRQGVTYPALADALKAVFVDVARGELQRASAPDTQSALSLLSGVHRKDIRAFVQQPRQTREALRPTLASQVFTRWLGDRRYREPKTGAPRQLARSGAGKSFESLCREFSNDVHPRAVLDELLRQGLVALEGDRVVARAEAYLPAPGSAEQAAIFAASTADHIAAAVSNLTTDAPKFLEQSIYADGLTPESIALLHAAARKAWAQAFDAVIAKARERVDADRQGTGEQRMRMGVYFFSDAAPASLPASAPAPAARKTTRKRT